MRDGSDGDLVSAIVGLYEHRPAEVVGELADRLLARAAGEEIDLTRTLAQDPAGRYPSDENLRTLLRSAHAGDLARLQSLTGGSYDSLLVLLLGAIVRLEPPL